MASRVQKMMFWHTFKNAKSVNLDFFPVADIGRNIHLLYFSYPQEIYSQFVEWGKKVLSPYSPQWSVYFSVSLLQIAGKHPVYIHLFIWINIYLSAEFNFCGYLVPINYQQLTFWIVQFSILFCLVWVKLDARMSFFDVAFWKVFCNLLRFLSPYVNWQ